MAQSDDGRPHSPFSREPNRADTTTIPILPSSGSSSESPRGEPMDISLPASASMAPPAHSSPEMETNPPNTGPAGQDAGTASNGAGTHSSGLGAAAAATAQQPKVVQTAFIHKLYNMLEDPSIKHLITWSSSNESFLMSPSSEFSKVLSQYFKHTNISSFVRQLNMYGFHKVSDVFHNGSPESPLWEFKHGNGNFKRGDLVGLREIKRRASRHALIHRDSFSSNQKPHPSQPVTPAEPAPDTAEVRLSHLEHTMYDLHTRLARSEDFNANLSAKCQALTEGLVRCHQWNQTLCQFVSRIANDPDSQLHREAYNMQNDIARYTDMLRGFEESHESLLSGRQPFFSNISLDPTPLSPRQLAQDDQRRHSAYAAPRQNIFRAPLAPHLSISPRRYGSIGPSNPSPSSLRPQAPQPPPFQHPLASVTTPPTNLPRRHTSADIRQTQGWQGATVSPFGSGQSSAQWPSSPDRTPNAAESSQHVRDVLAQYELPGPTGHRPSYTSGQATPPLTSDTTASNMSAESGWSLGGSRFPPKPLDTSSYPPTRRSSMASNVHSLLNPAETAETADEDDAANEDRKRKRMQ